MFDRGVLFVGSGGIGLGVLAEALTLDCQRKSAGPMPLRVYSATMNETTETDSILVRAMERMGLDTSGLSLKPLALYAFAGAPRIDHVVMLGASLPAATRLALGDAVDVRNWDVEAPKGGDTTPSGRYMHYMKLAEALRAPVAALVTKLTSMDGVAADAVANSA